MIDSLVQLYIQENGPLLLRRRRRDVIIDIY
jgi:hypothetical protein